tara:strand:+ start:340 stop:747 length:408 start_codon:yes stop_codon:yes gene_type:complete
MSLIRFNTDPFFDSFDDFFSPFTENRLASTYQSRVPRSKVQNLDDKHVIKLATPGVEKENLLIDVKDGKVTVSYDEGETDPSQTGNFQSSFKQCWTLPKNADPKKVSASYNNGVLAVEIPKKSGAESIARKIEIN